MVIPQSDGHFIGQKRPILVYFQELPGSQVQVTPGSPQPAGYYNFTYVLQDGVSMNGYGKSVWEVHWGHFAQWHGVAHSKT
jgi:hypothetical protein